MVDRPGKTVRRNERRAERSSAQQSVADDSRAEQSRAEQSRQEKRGEERRGEERRGEEKEGLVNLPASERTVSRVLHGENVHPAGQFAWFILCLTTCLVLLWCIASLFVSCVLARVVQIVRVSSR